MGVSLNGGTPKSSILIGFSIINHPFWGTPIFGNTHMFPNQTWLRLDRNAWSADDIQRCKTGALMMSPGWCGDTLQVAGVFCHLCLLEVLSLFSDISTQKRVCLPCQRMEWSGLLFLRAKTKIDFSLRLGDGNRPLMTWCNGIETVRT